MISSTTVEVLKEAPVLSSSQQNAIANWTGFSKESEDNAAAFRGQHEYEEVLGAECDRMKRPIIRQDVVETQGGEWRGLDEKTHTKMRALLQHIWLRKFLCRFLVEIRKVDLPKGPDGDGEDWFFLWLGFAFAKNESEARTWLKKLVKEIVTDFELAMQEAIYLAGPGFEISRAAYAQIEFCLEQSGSIVDFVGHYVDPANPTQQHKEARIPFAASNAEGA